MTRGIRKTLLQLGDFSFDTGDRRLTFFDLVKSSTQATHPARQGGTFLGQTLTQPPQPFHLSGIGLRDWRGDAHQTSAGAVISAPLHDLQTNGAIFELLLRHGMTAATRFDPALFDGIRLEQPV